MFPAAMTTPFQAAVVKTGIDVRGRKVLYDTQNNHFCISRSLTSHHVKSRFDHGAPRRPETGLPWPPGTKCKRSISTKKYMELRATI